MTKKSKLFDLMNISVYNIQKDNAKLFKQRSFLGRMGFYLFVAFFAIAFSEFIVSVDLLDKYPVLWSIFVVGMFFMSFGTLWGARCPNCKSHQPGVVYTIKATGISYSKGVSPFASKCVKCGYYLSLRKLKQDYLGQKNIAEGNSVSKER